MTGIHPQIGPNVRAVQLPRTAEYRVCPPPSLPVAAQTLPILAQRSALYRCRIGPLLDEPDPGRVFCINMTIVGDAAGFGARAGRVFYAQHQCFGAVFGADGRAAGDDDHLPSLAGRA